MNTDSQWSRQEACFARATRVWLAVNHNTSVTSGWMFEAYCTGKWAWQLSIKCVSFMRLWVSFMRLWTVAKMQRFIKSLLRKCEYLDSSPPVKYFNWPFQCGTSFVDHFCYLCLHALCLSYFRVCSLLPCGRLLGKGWPLSSCLFNCVFAIWYMYPGSGVVLDCIDSWSLPPFLLRMWLLP